MIDSIRRFRTLHIKRSDFVVEIGSGNDPYWRSDLLVDKYVGDSTERPGGHTPLLMDRPFLIGDALSLPFQEKSVDFLIARNILEHIADVESFVAELSRVSRRGYITVPSAVSEKLFGWTKHFWFIRSVEGKLVLSAKDAPLYDKELSAIFHYLHANDKSFQRFYRSSQSLFVVEHVWEGELALCVNRDGHDLKNVKTAQATFDLAATKRVLASWKMRRRFRTLVAAIARHVFSSYHFNSPTRILDRLACPVCRGSLVAGDQLLICSNCDSSYPIVNSVPILAPEVCDRY